MSTQQSAALDERAVDLAKLRTCLEQALVGLKVPESHAGPIAEVLLDAELRGYDDHGVFFLGELARWFRSGALNPAPEIRVVQETESALLLDGDRGCAVVASHQAMSWCVERTRTRGTASAGIRNSGHFIAAAPYPSAAAKAGFIALAAANVTPLMPPPGGRTRTLGTNPLAFAAPTGGDIPLGRPTTNPADFDQGGLLLPVGGHKGFGLALMVEVLAGVLTGAEFGAQAGVTDGREGHFFMVIDPGLFIPRDQFIRRMDDLVRHVKSGERLNAIEEIVVPGERGQRRAAELQRSGRVPLHAVAWNTLAEVCGSLGVALPG